METTVKVHWDIYMEYGRYFCLGAYASNLKYMYSSASGSIDHCSEFI